MIPPSTASIFKRDSHSKVLLSVEQGYPWVVPLPSMLVLEVELVN